MDALTLREAMQPSYIDDSRWAGFAPVFNEALIAAECTTVRRVAAFCSQVGHESAGLRLFREGDTAQTPSWSWDRERYRGRGPIQLTWQSNYAKFGQWCKGRGYIDDPSVFVDHPELVEQPRWGFLAASWYWLNAGPFAGRLNEFADDGDIVNVSRGVNGNVPTPNGMTDRRERWQQCLALGNALLPAGGFLMGLNDGQQGEVLTGTRQWAGPTKTVRRAPDWLRKFLPKSFSDAEGVWPRDELDAIVNEVVTGVFDLTSPIDFGGGKVYAPKDVPPEIPVNFVTLLRVVGARQAVAQGLLK